MAKAPEVRLKLQDGHYAVTAGARHPRPAPRDRSRSGRLFTWQRCCTSSMTSPASGRSRDGTCRIGNRSASVPLGRQFAAWLGLTPLQKSSVVETARSYQQDGRQVPAQAAHCRMTSLVRRAKYNPVRWIHAWRICSRENPPGVATVADGEQNRASHLGDHGAWRDLSCWPPAGTDA